MEEKLVIHKKAPAGHGYKKISIRMKKELADQLDVLAKETGRTKTEVIQILLQESLKHVQITGE